MLYTSSVAQTLCTIVVFSNWRIESDIQFYDHCWCLCSFFKFLLGHRNAHMNLPAEDFVHDTELWMWSKQLNVNVM